MRIEKDATREIPVEAVEVGDLLQVSGGMVCARDGTVRSGAGLGRCEHVDGEPIG